MLLTLILALVFILAVCVLLYAAVGLIQNNKLFTTAPKDIQAAAAEHPERFRGAHALGWKLAVLSLLTIVGVFVYGGYDGVRQGFSFWQHWLRFAAILYLWKAFDIVCLDWLLLTKSHFFQHFYPETEGFFMKSTAMWKSFVEKWKISPLVSVPEDYRLSYIIYHIY